MAGIFMPRAAPTPQAPPPVPTIDSAEVQRQAQDQLKKRSQAQGRASTFLTNPALQMDQELNQQKMALG